MREAAVVDHISVGLLQLELLSNDGDTFYAGCKLNRPVIIYSGGHGFCLRSVDFGSTSEHEGDTVDSIIKAQAQALDNGFLKYFCTEPLEHFHHCVCKNTSLNIACKLQYDFVVSLDADGFTGLRGGMWLLERVNDAMRSKQKLVGTWQFLRHVDGTFGRIGLQPAVWRKFVYLDESLQQASYHDFDIVKWIMPHHGVEVLHLKDAKFNKHIPNSKEITFSSFMSSKQ